MKQSKIVIAGVVVVIVIVVVAVLAMGGKKDSSTSTTPTLSPDSTQSTSTDNNSSSQAVATTSSTLKDFAFSPLSIKIKVGDTVTWTNQDSAKHSVVASGSTADAPNGPLIGQGETYKFTFTKAGTYTLTCGVHPNMHQIVEVTE